MNTVETNLLIALLGTDLLVALAGFVMLYKSRNTKPTIDTETAVSNALLNFLEKITHPDSDHSKPTAGQSSDASTSKVKEHKVELQLSVIINRQRRVEININTSDEYSDPVVQCTIKRPDLI